MKKINNKIGIGIISSMIIGVGSLSTFAVAQQNDEVFNSDPVIIATEKVKHSTRYIEDEKLPVGVEVKVKNGQDGEKQTIIRNEIYRLGNVLNLTEIEESNITTPPSDEVIRVGKNDNSKISGTHEKIREVESQKKTEIAIQKESERLKKIEEDRLAQEKIERESLLASNRNDSSANSNVPSSAGITLSADSQGNITSPAENRAFLATIVSGEELKCADSVVMKESGYKTDATNPSSGAYGVAQSLPANKYSTHGSDWKTNGKTQILWMKDYVADRYGTFCNALEFHKVNNWY